MICIDVYTIKKHIIDNPEYIELLLEDTGFHHITNRQDEYRCARDEDTNPTSIRIKKDTLGTICFSTGIKGDIITLLQERLGLSFPNALKYICNTLGLSAEDVKEKDIILPFGGYFRNIGVNKERIYTLQPLEQKCYDKYKTIPNQMFYEDGISFSTQYKYRIGYDAETMRVTIPWWDFQGNVIGIMGRYNKRDVSSDINKYFPIYSFPKHQALYGYYQNYESIQEKQIVIIGESEKFTQQLDSMGIYNGISLGGNSISSIQARNIQALNPRVIILAFDEGLDRDLIEDRAEILKLNNIFMKNNVYYVYDKYNKYMPQGSKVSPTDMGKDVFISLLQECLIEV